MLPLSAFPNVYAQRIDGNDKALWSANGVAKSFFVAV
jgi:hypothetical protein